MTTVLDDMRQLADFIAAGQVPAPHSLHLHLDPADAGWTRQVADDPAIAGKLGLRPRTVIGLYRTLGGYEGVEVRLSWMSDTTTPDREHMVAALRTLADLAQAVQVPAPQRIDALHATDLLGASARHLVEHVAAVTGARRVADSGNVVAVKRIGDRATYSVHGFLR